MRRCAAPPRRALPDVTILVRQRWHTARVRGGRAHLALALEPGRLGGREAALRLVQLAPCAHQRGFCAEQSGAASRSVVRSRRREGNLRCVCGDGPRAMRPTRKADRKSSSVREPPIARAGGARPSWTRLLTESRVGIAQRVALRGSASVLLAQAHVALLEVMEELLHIHHLHRLRCSDGAGREATAAMGSLVAMSRLCGEVP